MTKHNDNSLGDRNNFPVDMTTSDAIRFAAVEGRSGQGTRASETKPTEGFKINEDAWEEFVLISQYVFHDNPDAEIADVFEFLRLNDMGGMPYSESLINRVTREVESECGPF